MNGPIRLVRSDNLPDTRNLGPIYEWSEGRAYLKIDKVFFKDKPGSILCYYNPPVHQVGNPGLDAYIEGLSRVFDQKEGLDFLILYGANDPVHAGGDLKESLTQLDQTLEKKKEKEAAGISPEAIDRLFQWADTRLAKGIMLHTRIRAVAQWMRVVALCGGGIRFGGSAEIPLMADYIIGDARSGICFSEAMIGLIPGWSGIARTLIKAGLQNTQYMSQTSTVITADQAQNAGIYNAVVHVPFAFPRQEKTADRDADRTRYREQMDIHNDDSGRHLLPKAFEIATCRKAEIPCLESDKRLVLATNKEISDEVERRKNPQTYAHIWNKPIKEVQREIDRLGKPLAPQSIEALNRLFAGVNPDDFDEKTFVKKEAEADARLYRDSRFRVGLKATLEQRVAKYGES